MLTTRQKGAIAEAEITAAATRLDIAVLRPLSEGLRYDLMLDLHPRLLRVQCKWGSRRGDVIVVRTSTCRHTPAGYVKTTYSTDEIDAVAIYCGDVHRCFLMPIGDVAGLHTVHLRLAPARNNQQLLVKMAGDYDLAKMVRDLGL